MSDLQPHQPDPAPSEADTSTVEGYWTHTFGTRLVERTAEAVHTQWCGIVMGIANTVAPTQGEYLSPQRIALWQQLVDTPYADIPEQGKTIYRHQAIAVLRAQQGGSMVAQPPAGSARREPFLRVMAAELHVSCPYCGRQEDYVSAVGGEPWHCVGCNAAFALEVTPGWQLAAEPDWHGVE